MSGYLPVAALLLLPALAQAVPWSTRAPLDVPRQEVAVAELGGLVYVIGGFDGTGSIVTTVEAYDPASDSWSTKAPVPVPIHHTTATAANGKLYVIGGWSDFFATALSSVYEYDPVADSWSPPKAPMPTPRGSPAAAEVGGLVYVAGGWNAGLVSDFAAYDPTADMWTPLAPMPTGRNHLGAAGLAGKFYAVGGRTDLGAGLNNVATVEVYEPGVGWGTLTPLPRARGGLALASAASRLFAFGGEGNDDIPSGVFPDVDAYDPATNLWAPRAPMPTPRHGIGAAVLAGRIHIPGGGPVEGFGVSAEHEVFDPEPPASIPAIPLAGAALLGLALAVTGRVRRETISPPRS